MNGGGQITFGGEGELPAEDFDLFVEWRAAEAGETRVIGPRAIENPTVETDFAERSMRIFVELAEQVLLPVRSAIADVPGMQTKTGNESSGKARS